MPLPLATALPALTRVGTSALTEAAGTSAARLVDNLFSEPDTEKTQGNGENPQGDTQPKAEF